MTEGFGRRDFLKGAVAGSVAATATNVAEAQAQPAASPAAAGAYQVSVGDGEDLAVDVRRDLIANPHPVVRDAFGRETISVDGA